MRQRSGFTGAKIRAIHQALTALNSLAGFAGHLGEPVNQVQKEVRARCLAWRRGGAQARTLLSAEAALSALLRGMSVYGDDGPSNTLVPFNADLVSVPEGLDDAPELLEVASASESTFLEGDQERMQLEHGCEVEVPQPHLDPAFKHNRRRALRFFWETGCQWIVPARAHRQRVRWTVLDRQGRW